MIMTVWKLNSAGVVKQTAIVDAPTTIQGFEPTTMLHKGQKVTGTKVYTNKGQFKIFVNPDTFGKALHHLLVTKDAVALPVATSQKAFTVTQSAKALLPSGK